MQLILYFALPLGHQTAFSQWFNASFVSGTIQTPDMKYTAAKAGVSSLKTLWRAKSRSEVHHAAINSRSTDADTQEQLSSQVSSTSSGLDCSLL